MNRTAIVIGLGLAASVALVSALAGPLNPPAGPVAPTAKPLGEIEPRIAINSTNTPGDNDATPSVSASMIVPVGKIGIEIAATPVTIDLNGFAINGGDVSEGGVYTALTSSPGSLVVRNGSVMRCTNGIDSLQPNTIVEGVVAQGNRGIQIRANSIGHISRCIVSGGSTGILLGGGEIVDCVVEGASDVGVNPFGGCAIERCSIFDCGGDGLRAGAGGCTVRDCTVYTNTGNGIVMPAGSTVSGNTCTGNGLDGISVSSRCVVSDNVCASNGAAAAGGAGVHISSSRNRVEGNHCTLADTGVLVDGTLNIIARNSCSGNTLNWSIAAGNNVAPIVLAGSNAAAISGNTFAGSLGTTDANANFTH